MNWLLLTIAAILARATYGVLSKILSVKLTASAPTTSILLLSAGAMLSLIMSPLLGGLSTEGIEGNAGAILVIVASSAAGNIVYFRGIAHLESSVAQIAFSSIVGWGAILSVVVLDSAFHCLQLAGCGGLIVAIIVSQYESQRQTGSGVWMIVVSAGCFAVFQVVSAKVADDLTTASYLVLSQALPALSIAVFFPRRVARDVKTLSSRAGSVLTITTCTAVCSSSYFAFAYFAYRQAPDPGVVLILLASQVVVAVLLSAALLNERSHLRRKVSAGVVAAISAALIRS